MKHRFVLIMALFLGPALAWSQGEEEAVAIQAAIASLSADDFQERESASAMLWKAGGAAVEALEQASKSGDPEVAYRARILWDRIRTGVGPDTPPAIVELVQKYHLGGSLQKRRVLESLRRANAFSQVLRLYYYEKDEAARRQSLELVRSVVLSAVQLALLAGDDAEAIALLKIAPQSDENYRRLAGIYRETGQLEEVMTSLSELEDLPSRSLLLACYRAKGDLAATLEFAESLGRDDVIASLSVLQGDPLPFLNWRINNRETETLVRLHLEIVRERWLGNEEKAAGLGKSMAEVARGSLEDSYQGLHSLLLNGYFEPASKVMRRDHPLMMFAYHEAMEEPWKAMEFLGYSRDEAVRKKWSEEVLRKVAISWDYYLPECQAYMSVAGILYERGRTEEGVALIRLMMEAAQEAGVEPWQDFLEVMGARGGVFYEIGFALLAEQIEPETMELKVLRYVSALLGEGDAVQNTWSYLGKVTDLNLRGRFLALGKVYGVVPAPAEDLKELWGQLLGHAEKAHTPMQVYRALLEPAFYREDASAILKLMTLLSEDDPKGQWLVSLANFQSFLFQWEESEKIWSSMMGEGGVGKRYLASYAGVLLRLGQDEKAHGLLDSLNRGCLDEPLLLSNIAGVLESNGAWEVATTYWRRILLTAAPSDRHWNTAAERLMRSEKKNKNWRVVASLAQIHHGTDSFEEESYQMNPILLLRHSFAATFFQALAELEEGNKARGEGLLRSAFNLLLGDGSLADDFFPLLREEGYLELHDEFFEKAYARLVGVLKEFPDSHNTHNGAAWLASRSARRLDEAEEHAATALKLRPRQAAYLDTMAEVWFARRDREKAVMWSERALRDSQFGGHSTLGGAELRAQYDRFVSGEFPVR